MKRVLVAVMVLALIWAQCPVFAQSVPTEPVTEVNTAAEEAASAAAAEAAVNLNLSSTVASFAAPTNMTSSVDLNLGGVMTSIAPGSAVTAAQMIALQQVMQTGTQTLVLDSFGAAQSGTFSLNSSLTQMLSSLTIPEGVTALAHASELGALNMSGNLVNSGSFYLYSTNSAVTAASVSALNIFNNQGAVLSTSLPSFLQGSLPTALSSLSLNLSAINNIVNAGTIASSGNLNLYAGGSITNVGANAVMQAMQSMNLTAMTGNIANSGLMAANFGSINVNAAQIANMTVNNLGGVMQALNGSINFREQSYAGAANISLLGGDYLSKVLNVHGGQGSVDLNVNNVTGVVNAWAECVRIAADSPFLQLGVIDASGDPYVTVTGNLDISSTTYSPYLVAIAGENIFTSQSNTALVTGGGSLVLVAGAIAINEPGACPTCISVDRSESGGDIYLKAGATFVTTGPVNSQDIVAIGTSSSTGNAGNLTLIAFADSETTQTVGGHVFLPTSVQINTDGSNSGVNGNLTIIAEAASGASDSISIGDINSKSTVFGDGPGGRVTLSVATPNFGPGPGGPIINTANGNTTGSFDLGPIAHLQNGAISVGTIVTGGARNDITHTTGSIKLSTAGDITAVELNAAGVSGNGAGAFGTGQNGGHGSDIKILAGGVIVSGSILAFGAGGGGGGGASSFSSLTGGNGGNGGAGGSIFVATSSTAANAINIVGDVNSSGGGGGGGGGGAADGSLSRNTGPGGSGGAGGAAGSIEMSSPSTILVTGNVYAVGGGDGGAGLGGQIAGNFDNSGGGGGGGGGSFGGSGGGGGGGVGHLARPGTPSQSGLGGGSGSGYSGGSWGTNGTWGGGGASDVGGAGGGGGGFNQTFTNVGIGAGGFGGLGGGPGFAGNAQNGFAAGDVGAPSSILLRMNALVVSGVLNAKHGMVEIIPYSATSIILGSSGSTPSVLYLDSALLSSITAETVSIGSPTYAGGIFVSADTFLPYDAGFRTSSDGGVETISGVLTTNSLTIEAGYIGGVLQPLLILAPNLSARSSSGDVYIQDNTSVTLSNSGAASGIVIDFHILVPVSGGSITVQSPIIVDGAGGQIHLEADGDILDPSGSVLQASNINLSGNNIGDIDHPLFVAAGVPGGTVNLSLNSANDYIVDTNPGETINLGPINATGSISIVENGSITISAPISVAGILTLSTAPGSNGAIVVNDTITTHDKIHLTADGTGVISINAGIDSNDNDIILTAANVVATSTVDAGSGTVHLIPNSNEPIVVNGTTATPPGTFYVTGGGTGLLNQITASKVIVGSPLLTGSTTLANSLTLGGAGYAFEMIFANNGPFISNGNAINTTGRSVSITSNDDISLGSVRVIDGSLILISRRNILFTNIDTSSFTSDGGNIVMVAGANFDYSGAAIDVTGSSTLGGSILQNAGGTTLQSFSTVGAGGKIVIVANESSSGGDGTGTVLLRPATVIYSYGTSDPSGDVVVVAGGNTGSGAAISIYGINTSGGVAGTGNITLVSASSTATVTAPVSVNGDTGVITGDFCCGPIQNGSIFVNTIVGNGESTTTLKSGNTMQVSSVFLDGVFGQNGGSLVLVSGFALGPSQQEFSIGGTAASRVGFLTMAPGSGATTYGNFTLRNNGDISIVQQIRAESVDIKTTMYNGNSSGRIFDIGAGNGSVAGIVANNIILVAEGGGPIFGQIGVTIAANGNPKVALQASTDSGYVNITSLGSVSIIGNSKATDNLSFSLRTASGSNGSIEINHDVTVNSPLGVINLTADGSGTITRPNFAGTLYAKTINLVSGSGDLGSDASSIDMQTPNVNFSTTGSIYLQTVGPQILPVVSKNAGQTFSFRTSADGNGDASITLTNNGLNPTITAGTIKLFVSGNNPGSVTQQAPASVASLSAKNITLEGGGPSGTMNLTIQNKIDNSGVEFTYGGTNYNSVINNIGDINLVAFNGGGGSLTITAMPDINGQADISSAPGSFLQLGRTDLTLITLGLLSTITTGSLATSSFNGGGKLKLVSQGGDITTGNLDTDNANVSNTGLSAGDLEIITGTASINGGNINVGNIKASSYTFPIFMGAPFTGNTLGKGGNVLISSVGNTASGSVQTGSIRTEGDRGGGAVNIVSEFSFVRTGVITSFNGERKVGGISGLSIGLNGGDVNLTAGTSITVQGAIETYASQILNAGGPFAQRVNGVGGNVHLVANGASAATGSILVMGNIITIGDIGSGNVVIESRGGNISLQDIHAENVHRTLLTPTFVVGSVTITTGTLLVRGGSIVVGSINTSSPPLLPSMGNIGGDVTLSSNGNDPILGSITIQGDIDTIGRNANGNVAINTTAGDIVHTSGQIKAGMLSLMSFSGNIGTQPASSGRAITTAVSSLEFRTVGDVYVDQTGDLTIESSVVNNFPYHSRVEITASGSIFLNGSIGIAESLTLVSGADILNSPLMFDQITLSADQITLQAAGTIGLSSDYLLVRRGLSGGVTASSPNFIEESILPPPFGPPPPPPPLLGAVLDTSLDNLASGIITNEIEDLGIFDEGGTSSLENQLIANSNVNILQGGEQVVRDIQAASHNSLDNNINSQNFVGNLGDNAVSNQAQADDQALGQNFAYCNAGDFNSGSIGQMQSHGATIGSASTGNLCVLQQGNFFFQPNSNISVQVQEGSVEIPAGASVLVMETGNDVAVFDINDGPNSPVRVKSGNKIITLSPGKQVVLTRQLAADFDKINPSKLIGYKNPKSQLVASDIRAYSADFSLPSVMMSVAPIKRMLTSDSPAERKLVQRMIKRSVVLSMLPSHAGPFKTSSSRP